MTLPNASMSLDLDNQWSYMKTHGDPGWESYPSYLDTIVPHALRCLSERELAITFFIVGLDAEREENHRALRSIAEAGHEIASHSFKHEQWLHLYSEDEIVADLERAEVAIEKATGCKPRGFRGPGFSCSSTTLEILRARGYAYDCSTFPTFLGPLARMYYFWTANLTAEEKEQRKYLFGTLSEGFRSVKPYEWSLPDGTLLELPVTTMPIFKVPFHVSYLLYLGTYSHALAKLYFWKALTLCRLTGVQPSLLLHPLDFLGGDDCDALAFFPAMGMTGEEKRRRTCEFIDMFRRRFQILPVRKHAEAIRAQGQLRRRPPVFRAAPDTVDVRALAG